MGDFLLISDAAKEVKVEAHVLRYWEEELHLPIKRNELGHRYYTCEDVDRFKQIKSMKDRGLQLKAIKMILKDGKLDVLPEESFRVLAGVEEKKEAKGERMEAEERKEQAGEESCMPITVITESPAERDAEEKHTISQETSAEKAKRLQWLLQQLIRDTLKENNQELCQRIKESIVKELDYQFREQEEREEERTRAQNERNEEYYKKMDELLRSKSIQKAIKKKKEKKPEEQNSKPEDQGTGAVEKQELSKTGQNKTIDINSRKKKRHFIF